MNRSFFVTPLLLILSLGLSAAHAVDTDLLQPFPNATVEQRSEQRTDHYLLALGTHKRVSGDWRLEHSERLAGTLSRVTYRIPDGYSAGEAQRHWLAQLLPAAKTLYSCRGRGCGPSNRWANGVFEVPALYGLDQEQYYDALEFTHDQRRYALALYSVQRGNKRVFSHLDILALDETHRAPLVATAEGLLAQLRDYGSVALAVTVEETQLAALTDALQQNAGLTLYVVGHAYGVEPLAELQRRSLGYAEKLVALLVQRGIKAERVLAQGVGPLAPGAAGRVDRLELVRRSD